MKRFVVAFALALLAMGVASGQVLKISVKGGVGVVGKPSSFKIKLNATEARVHVPIDAVLVIDTSGSMRRWSDVIAGGWNNYVNLTLAKGSGVYIGSFTINQTSNVELVLQTPNDIYNSSDSYKARLASGGVWVTKWNWSLTTDPAVVRWYGLPAGTYDIYVRLVTKGKILPTTTRIMMVELPPTRIEVAKRAAKAFVGLTQYSDRVGVVNFSGNATILLNLTYDKYLVNQTIDSINAVSALIPYTGKGMGGKHKTLPINYSATNIAAGIEDAIKMLDAYGRKNAVKVIILLTDGWRNTGDDPVYWAEVARSRGYLVYTVGIGGANVNELKEIAEAGGGKYYYAHNGSELVEIYKDIYRDVDCYAYNVTLNLRFNVQYLNSTPPGTVYGNTVTWHWRTLKSEKTIDVYVKSDKEGTYVVASGYVSYNDYWGYHKERVDVVMTFVRNFIVNATPDKSTITEYENVNITIMGNYPIKSVNISAVPPINRTNSIINISYDGYVAVVSWTPLPNYVNRNTTAVLKFNVTSVYGVSNSTGVEINVINLPPVILKAEPNRSAIYEEESVAIYVKSNYDITSLSVQANPPIINGVNSILKKEIDGKTATIIWKPLICYTDRNVSALIRIYAICKPYGSNSTYVRVKVYNLNTYVIITPHHVNGTEGRILFIKILTSAPPDFLNFTIKNSTVPIRHLMNSTVFSLNQINDTFWLFAIAPQYNLTSNNSVENMTIIWYARKGNLYAMNYTIVSIRDNSTVDRLPHPLVSNALDITRLTINVGINTSRPVYIGEPAFIRVVMVNSTGGWIKVNRIKIWEKKGLPGPNVSARTIFVPNVAGAYLVRAYATNGSFTVPSDVTWFVARIKPVSPS